MSSTKTAYVTGGASGIGLAVTEMLVSHGIRVAIADKNLSGAQSVAARLDGSHSGLVSAFEINAASWESQKSAFEQVLAHFGGRIDYVYPIAGVGERVSIPNDPNSKEFVKPDLTTLDVDLYGLLYTASLAIQQMRRQKPDAKGLRGRIAVTASVCGFYCVPTLPIYTAAKHGVVGFVRSFGKYLPEEGISLNAVCPNVVRTAISTGTFYDQLESKGLLTPMKGVVDAFEHLLDAEMSGECLEVGPKGGFVLKAPPEHLDHESAEVMNLLYSRGHGLHEAKSN